MSEDQLKGIIAELTHSTGQALGLIVAALARQVDAQKLTDDLSANISAAKRQNVNSLTLKLATEALAAAEAESALQNQAKH